MRVTLEAVSIVISSRVTPHKPGIQKRLYGEGIMRNQSETEKYRYAVCRSGNFLIHLVECNVSHGKKRLTQEFWIDMGI